MLEKKKTNWKR